jgi:DNA-binding NtrC family response regulator
MNSFKINILLIEDEEFDVRRVHKTIKHFNEKLIIRNVVSNGMKALELIENNPDDFDVVIMDYQIAGGIRGEKLIKKIKEIDPSIQIIVITKMTINITDFELANSMMSSGAFWYCTKYPGDIEDYIYQPTDFIISILNAYEKRKLERQSMRSNKKLTQNIEELLETKRLIGNSKPIQVLRKQIEKYAGADPNILISGETGTGKELVAYNIHYKSKRKFEKFVTINCGSLPHELIESELFGYIKGAFTGAVTDKKGLFEIANNGTIFLDEVSELPLPAQVKLLRVIQNGEIEKIGRVNNIKVNVRIIAATNKNLEEEVKENRFREDLYYRLNVIPIYVAPLTEKEGDIQLLIDYFMNLFVKEMGLQKPFITDEAIDLLVSYNWPGNVRELKNIVQRLLLNFEDKVTTEDVKYSLLNKNVRPRLTNDSISFWNNGDFLPLKDIEKLLKEKYLTFIRKNSKSDADAAKKLGLAPPNFHRLCKELGLK